MRADRAWLLDILEALSKIEKYASRGEKAFCEDDLIQGFLMRSIRIPELGAGNLMRIVQRCQNLDLCLHRHGVQEL